MRKAIALVLALAVSGCVPPPHVSKPRVPTGTGSTDWSVVMALPAKGAFLFVTLDDGRTLPGILWCASDSALTVFGERGEESIARAEIVRIAKRVQIGTKHSSAYRYVGVPATIAALGGLAGAVIGAINKNGTLKHVSWWVFAVSLGLAIGV